LYAHTHFSVAGNSSSSGRCFRKASYAVKNVNLLISIMASEGGLELERERERERAFSSKNRGTQRGSGREQPV